MSRVGNDWLTSVAHVNGIENGPDENFLLLSLGCFCATAADNGGLRLIALKNKGQRQTFVTDDSQTSSMAVQPASQSDIYFPAV